MELNNKQTQHQFSSITRTCFINAPFEQLQAGLLDFIVQYNLQPEIGLEGGCLWSTPKTVFQDLANTLQNHGLPCTLHAPFFDLAPGGIDAKVREVSREKLRLAFELIPVFKPRSIVCHLGYEENKHSYKLEQWLQYSLETWQELVKIAEQNNSLVMFENTYESTPDIHHRLLTEIRSDSLKFCLDTGHLMAYAGTPWQLWLDKLLPWLGQLHLHDNNGLRDDHIAIGQGNFNFTELLNFLREKKSKPLITLEPHSQEDLWLSLKNIHQNNLLKGFLG